MPSQKQAQQETETKAKERKTPRLLHPPKPLQNKKPCTQGPEQPQGELALEANTGIPRPFVE
jgi:hypothetical protein